MATERTDIEKFLTLSLRHPVFDVRSPSEFAHAHLPGAYSLPLFDDEQRKVVGTAYKQLGRSQGIKIGLDFFGVKMKSIVEEVELFFSAKRYHAAETQQTEPESSRKDTILIHCWRGGMRSAAVAWLLDLYGYKVYTLAGGYKAFRNRVLQQFDKPPEFRLIGGYTGSGKTLVLEELRRLGEPVINLEALANHKGSAFGALGEDAQPSQEMFENLLGRELYFKAAGSKDPGTAALPCWLEDESQRIGKLHLPQSLWQHMRNSRIFFIDLPFGERLNYLVDTYGVLHKDELLASLMRLKKKLGGLETKNAMEYLLENNIKACFSILLAYYDKCYRKALHNRTDLTKLLRTIRCSTVGVHNSALISAVANEEVLKLP